MPPARSPLAVLAEHSAALLPVVALDRDGPVDPDGLPARSPLAVLAEYSAALLPVVALDRDGPADPDGLPARSPLAVLAEYSAALLPVVALDRDGPADPDGLPARSPLAVLAEHSAAFLPVVALDRDGPVGWGSRRGRRQRAQEEAFSQVDSLLHSGWRACQEALAGREVARRGHWKDAKFQLRFCQVAGQVEPPVFAAAVRKELAEEAVPFLRRPYG